MCGGVRYMRLIQPVQRGGGNNHIITPRRIVMRDDQYVKTCRAKAGVLQMDGGQLCPLLFRPCLQRHRNAGHATATGHKNLRKIIGIVDAG